MVRIFKINKDKINEKLKTWAEQLIKEDKNVVSVVLFGSLAKGEATAKSDADILIIIKNSNKDFFDRSCIFTPVGVGISCDVFVYTIEEAKKKLTEKGSIVDTCLKDGLKLAGKDLNLIFTS